MDVYLARQPIFDRRMKVYGYELLYRRSMNNFYEGTNPNQSTAELINNAYLVMKLKEIASGKRAFINFSEDLLINEIPLLLPKEQIVVEILENINPTPGVLSACSYLKEMGYIIALDDFVFQEQYLPLLEVADIVKVEFSAVEVFIQKMFITKYRNRVRFLAEKVETREEYDLAHSLGYDYFQGYFFSKPIIIKGKETLRFNENLLRIAKEITDESFDYQKVAMIIERDVGLSYNLLKLANSAFYGSKYKIYSIKQALARLGIREIRKWVYLLMLRDVKNEEMTELINNSMIRAKFMELVAKDLGLKNRHLEFFLLGLFSSLDIILNKPMIEVVEDLALVEDVKKALLGEPNDLRKVLEQTLLFEKGNVLELENYEFFLPINQLMHLYIEALEWSSEISF